MHDKLIQKSQQPKPIDVESLTRLFNNDANGIRYGEFKKCWERIGDKIQGESNGGAQINSHCGVSVVMVVLEKELVLTCKKLSYGLDTLILEYSSNRLSF